MMLALLGAALAGRKLLSQFVCVYRYIHTYIHTYTIYIYIYICIYTHKLKKDVCGPLTPRKI